MVVERDLWRLGSTGMVRRNKAIKVGIGLGTMMTSVETGWV